MFEFLGNMGELLGLGVSVAGAAVGYIQARRYVRGRLRFVDQVHTTKAKLVAGGAATLAAAPVVWLLPFIGAPTAIVFGVSVGLGVSHGSKDVKRLNP